MPGESLLSAVDLAGVFAFALSGALVAVKKGLDIVGVLVLAWLAGLGGGITRDVLIGATPPDGLSDSRLVGTALAAGVVTFALHPYVARVSRLIRVVDAVGLGVFAVTGTSKALTWGADPLPAVIVGTVTAVGGGLLRDVVAGEVPQVLRRELYAVPAVVGAALTAALYTYRGLGPLEVYGVAAFVVALRLVAVVLDLHAPLPLRTEEPS